MKNILSASILLIGLSASSQITMEYELNLFPDTKGYDGKITICNNTGSTLPGGYQMKFQWPAVETIDYGLVIQNKGSESCDTLTLAIEEWETISDNTCSTFEIGGKYNPPMFLPPKGIGENGETIELVHSANSYIPGAENAGSSESEFYFGEDCFIKSPSELHIGEATLLEWGVATDMYFPDNKKSWAIANAHAHTLFNNLVGKEIITPNHFNATTLNESHCGCEDDIIVDPASSNPLTYQAGTVSDGCFQMTPTGWLQIEQFFPELVDGLSHSSIVSGDYVRSCLLRTYYDMTSLLYWEKVKCYNQLELFENSNDPYLAEEMFEMAFYRGFDFSGIEAIFNSKRNLYESSENVVEELYSNGDVDNGAVIYGMRQRNNAKQLDNNLTATWAENSMYYDPGIFNWRGWYNDDISWTDINAYLDEISPLFPRVDFSNVKTKVQTAFNEINSEGTIPFTQLGPVIDAIVLALPAYDGNKGMSVIYNNDISQCTSSSGISISSCSALCPGEKGEITVNLMGTPPFNFEIQGPNNEIYSQTNIPGSPVILEVEDPGKYVVSSFSDAISSPFINCHFAHAYVDNKGTSDADWDLTSLDNEKNCIEGPLNIIGTGPGPWEIYYEKDGITQDPISFSDSPYEVLSEQIPGTYKVTRMIAGGCDSPNNSEVEVCLITSEESILSHNYSIYPNPIVKGNSLIISGQDYISEVLIIDGLGKIKGD